MLYRWQKLDQARSASFFNTYEIKHCASFLGMFNRYKNRQKIDPLKELNINLAFLNLSKPVQNRFEPILEKMLNALSGSFLKLNSDFCFMNCF